MTKGKEKQDSTKEARFQARACVKLLQRRNQQNISTNLAAPQMSPSSVFPPSNTRIHIRYLVLPLDLNKDEVAIIISRRTGIPPTITHHAWNLLKVEKPELFEDYMERLFLRQTSVSNQSLEHHPPPATLAPLSLPVQGYHQNLLLGNLDEGDTIPIQVPIPFSNLQIDSVNTVSCRQFVNDEDSASSSSHPTQKINHGKGMMRDRNAADFRPPQIFNDSKIPNLASVTYNDQTQMSHFDAKAHHHPFSSFLPLPVEQQGENYMEQPGPGSTKLTGENENLPSATLIDSDTESSIYVVQDLNLPPSDTQ